MSACQTDHPREEEAIGQLCRDYWSPICSYLRRYRHDLHEAQELTQSFFAWLLESKAYRKADRSKGKFRTFLLTLLKHFSSTQREWENRQKRGGGKQFLPLDPEMDALEKISGTAIAERPPLDEEREFDRVWADTLVERALESLIAEYQGEDRTLVYRELEPFLRGGVGLPSQTEVAARLAMPIETLRSHLSRLRASYRLLLRQEVGRTVSSDADVDEELRYLCRVLIAAA